MPRYTAVLDACVLVPIALADTLLRVAEKGLYRPLWSDRILAEAQAATEEIHPGMDAGKRFAQMRAAFDDALVTGWEELEPGIWLPDQDDRHVLAAAIRGARRASSPRTRRTSPPSHSNRSGWRRSAPTTSCSTSSTSARPPSCKSSASKPPAPEGRHSPRETWRPSSAGQAYPASRTRSSASWPAPWTAPDRQGCPAGLAVADASEGWYAWSPLAPRGLSLPPGETAERSRRPGRAGSSAAPSGIAGRSLISQRRSCHGCSMVARMSRYCPVARGTNRY